MAGNANAIRAGRAFVEVFADNSKLISGLRGAEAHLKRFGQRVGDIGRRMLTLGASMAVPFALAGRTFAGFEDQMLTVKAVTRDITEGGFKKLTEQAKLLGRTTSFTAQQVAGAMASLGRAGFGEKEIEAAIPSMLNLARATGTDLGESAKIAADAIRIFNLDASEMTRAADVLTAGANSANHILTEMAESMAYAGPIAREAGESIESTAKIVGVLANMGIKGSMAGTTLRQMFIRLADPGVRKELAKLGVNAVDAAGNMRPLGDVMIELGKAVANMPNAQRLSVFKELFDQRAMGGALKAGDAKQMELLGAAIDNAAGSAARAAKIMDSGLGGAYRKLMSAVEGVAIAIGEAMLTTLKDVMGAITTAIGQITAFIERNKAMVTTVLIATAALLGAGVALVALGVAAKLAAIGVAVLVVALKAVGLAIAIIANPASMLIAVIAALAAGALYCAGVFDAAARAFGEFWGGIKAALAKGDIEAAFNVVATGLKLVWLKTTGWMTTTWVEFTAGIKAIFEEAINNVMYGLNRLGKYASKVLKYTSLSGYLAERAGLLPSDEEWDAAQDARDKAHTQRMAQISQEEAAATKAVRREVEEAQRAYEAALAAARAPAAPEPGLPEAVAAKQIQQSGGGGGGGGSTMVGRGVGTFNPAAIPGLLGGASKTERLMENQLDVQKEMLRVLGNIDDNARPLKVI